MNMTAFIDVAIGLTLLYLGTSLFVTIINEFLAQMLSLRSRQLQTSLKKLFSQEGLKRVLTDYQKLIPVQKSDRTDSKSKVWSSISGWLERIGLGPKSPVGSYIEPNILAQILVGKLIADAPPSNSSTTPKQATGSPTPAPTPAQGGGSSYTAQAGSGSKTTPGIIGDSILKNVAAGPVKDVLMALAQGTGNEVDKLTKSISGWFDRSLTVLGEGYKKIMQVVSLGVGLVVAVSFNIDTLTVTDRLYRDKGLRDQAVAVAEEYAKNLDTALIEKCRLPPDQLEKSSECKSVAKVIDIAMKRSETLNLPIGWGDKDKFWDKLFSLGFFGWLLTALAVSLGAPFWFDLLNNLINVRHGINRPTVSEEKSKVEEKKV